MKRSTMTKEIFKIRPILPTDKVGMQEGMTQFLNESSNNDFFRPDKYCVKHQIPKESFHLDHKSGSFIYFEMALA